MDPQKLASLDPKLREAYQRVMGTPIPQPQTPNPTPEPIPDPTPAPPPMPEPEPIPAPPPIQPPVSEPQSIPTPEPSTPEPQPAIPQQPPMQANNFVQMNSEVAAPSQNFTAPMPQAQTMTVKKKQGMMTPILFGIVGLVFIAIYTLFWTKIFNFKLPFLP